MLCERRCRREDEFVAHVKKRSLTSASVSVSRVLSGKCRTAASIHQS